MKMDIHLLVLVLQDIGCSLGKFFDSRPSSALLPPACQGLIAFAGSNVLETCVTGSTMAALVVSLQINEPSRKSYNYMLAIIFR